MDAERLHAPWLGAWSQVWVPPLFLALVASLGFHIFVCGCLSLRPSASTASFVAPVELSFAVPGTPRKSVAPIPQAQPLRRAPEIEDAEKSDTAPAAATSAPAPASPGTTGQAVGGDVASVYREQVRQALDRRKTYPTAARVLGQTGTVVLSFWIARDGSVSEITLLQSSEFPRLDAAALQLIRSVGNFDVFPEALHAERIPIQVPIQYEPD